MLLHQEAAVCKSSLHRPREALHQACHLQQAVIRSSRANCSQFQHTHRPHLKDSLPKRLEKRRVASLRNCPCPANLDLLRDIQAPFLHLHRVCMAYRAAPNHPHPVQADHRMLHLLYNTILFSLLKIRGWSPLKESARMPLFLRGISLYPLSQKGIRQHHQLLPTVIQHRPHQSPNLDTHLHLRTQDKVC